MITIKQHSGKWRVEIENEKWEFESLEVMQNVLHEILKSKENFGQIK